jgi:hypothetical protein
MEPVSITKEAFSINILMEKVREKNTAERQRFVDSKAYVSADKEIF